jgi:hypothetical protein
LQHHTVHELEPVRALGYQLGLRRDRLPLNENVVPARSGSGS